MLNLIKSNIKSFFSNIKIASHQLKNQFPYEVNSITLCPKTKKHLVNIKITNKSQIFSCLAEEIVVDDSFLTGFSPQDIRNITYQVANDRFEAILEKDKIKKSYDLIWSKNINGDKTVTLKHKTTDETTTVSLKSFADSGLIEKLESQDAYNLGYLAGQEQTWKDLSRIKLVKTHVDSLVD